MKYLLILTYSLLVSSTTLGQKIYVLGGLNYTNVVPNDRNLEYGEYKFGYHFGILGCFEISNQVNIQSGIIYNQKGHDLEIPPPPGTLRVDDELRRNLNYLTIPIVAEVTTINPLSLVGGIELNYLASANEDPEISTGDNIRDNYSSFDLGLSMGLKLDPLPKTVVYLKYVYGLSDLVETFASNNNLRNRTLQLSIGYKLN
ncbi:MAG: porin family protein [Bacteroidota bacterium]